MTARYVAGNYRDLHAAVLALDINDPNAAMIARRLPATSTVTRRRNSVPSKAG